MKFCKIVIASVLFLTLSDNSFGQSFKSQTAQNTFNINEGALHEIRNNFQDTEKIELPYSSTEKYRSSPHLFSKNNLNNLEKVAADSSISAKVSSSPTDNEPWAFTVSNTTAKKISLRKFATTSGQGTLVSMIDSTTISSDEPSTSKKTFWTTESVSDSEIDLTTSGFEELSTTLSETYPFSIERAFSTSPTEDLAESITSSTNKVSDEPLSANPPNIPLNITTLQPIVARKPSNFSAITTEEGTYLATTKGSISTSTITSPTDEPSDENTSTPSSQTLATEAETTYSTEYGSFVNSTEEIANSSEYPTTSIFSGFFNIIRRILNNIKETGRKLISSFAQWLFGSSTPIASTNNEDSKSCLNNSREDEDYSLREQDDEENSSCEDGCENLINGNNDSSSSEDVPSISITESSDYSY